MERYWDLIAQIIKESDIVLEIVDARLIDDSRNPELERLIKESKRPTILVVNKSDLVSKKDLSLGMDHINRFKEEEFVYVSCKQKKTIRNLILRIKKVFEEHGKRKSIDYHKKRGTHREARADIVIGVVGYPNVGKSSIINALSFKNKAKVTTKAGTTHGIHWIAASDNLKLIDTPGVIPLGYMDKIKLGIIGAKGIEKIKEKDLVAAKIIEMFWKKDKTRFEKFYNIELAESLNPCEIIEELGRARAHLKKGGVVDENRTSTLIIKDWQEGRLRL